MPIYRLGSLRSAESDEKGRGKKRRQTVGGSSIRYKLKVREAPEGRRQG